MSPYEFTSKTHSLSTEDLGKIFIHSFIHWFIYLLTPREPFTISRKMSRKSRKNVQKMWMIVVVAIMLKRLCSGFRVHISKQNRARKLWKWLQNKIKRKRKIRMIITVAMMLKGLYSGSISKYRNSWQNSEKIAGKWGENKEICR